MSEIQFAITPSITQAIDTIKQSHKQSNKQSKNQSINQVIDAGLFVEGLEKISLEQAKIIVKAIKSIDQSNNQTISVHSLLAGSTLLPPPSPPRKPRDPEFVAFLDRMRSKAERREIAMLAGPINQSMNAMNETINQSNKASVAGETRELGHGVNILTLMGTGFAVFYYAGTMLFPHSKIAQILSGLFGLICALFMEITLLLIRERRRETYEQSINQANNQLLNNRSINQKTNRDKDAYELRKVEKEKSMMKLMEEFKQASKQPNDQSIKELIKE